MWAISPWLLHRSNIQTTCQPSVWCPNNCITRTHMTVCILSYQHKMPSALFCSSLSCTLTIYLRIPIWVSTLMRLLIIFKNDSHTRVYWVLSAFLYNSVNTMLQYRCHASANQPVKYVMLMNVLDRLSNLREYFQYFSLIHRLVTLCQILSQCPSYK